MLRVCSISSAALHVGYVPAAEVGAREYGGAGGGDHGGDGGDGEAHGDCFVVEVRWFVGVCEWVLVMTVLGEWKA